VLLAKQRSRLSGTPITVLSFAGFGLLLGSIFAVVDGGPAFFVVNLIFAAPVLIVMGLGFARERRGL
jgi:hypothetical protein